MKKPTKKIILLVGITVGIILISIGIIGKVLFKEMYCSIKVEKMRKNSTMIPATEKDVKQVPNLDLHVGQLIGWSLSEELACQRMFQ